MSNQAPVPANVKLPADLRIGIVAARFNSAIVDKLLEGCFKRLQEYELDERRIEVQRVPGAFELPVAAQAMARSGRVWGVICLGCVIRGETPHFDYIAAEAARGIQDVALREHLPITFGVLTTNTEEQAWDRVGGKHGHAGERAADAALEMISVMRAIVSPHKV